MFINVNLTSRKAVPWTADALAQLQAAFDMHRALPKPAKLGRAIGIPR